MGMYRIIHWARWRNRVLIALAGLLTLCAVGEPLFTRMAMASAPVVQEQVVLPVVMYHSMLPQKDRQGTYVISPTLFERDLQTIRQAGYTTVLAGDLIAYVERGSPLPEKPILLTFDDGYYNNYRYAFPLLQKYGMKAVISPVVGWSEYYSNHPEESDREIYSHLTFAQMREMTTSGLVEIQNHSYDLHYNKTGQRKGAQKVSTETETVYQAMLRQDLTTAQKTLAEQVGVPPTLFVYPYGAMSREALPVLRDLGLRGTLTCESRMNVLTRDPDCLWGLGRYLRPAGESSESYFRRLFQAAEEKRGG